MRLSTITSTLVFSVLSLNIIVLTPSCKKTAPKTTADSKFSFTYNGAHYVLPGPEGWSFTDYGITINRPDLFNGIIQFPYANCAYLDPNGNDIYVQNNADCQLTSNGFPIDSVVVYVYLSGSVNISNKHCVQKSVYSVSTGNTVYYDICDAEGTFDLVLKNKENKTITITEGKIEAYSFRR